MDRKALIEIVSMITTALTMFGMGWLALKQAELRSNVQTVKAQTETVMLQNVAQTKKIDNIEVAVDSCRTELSVTADVVRTAQARILAAAWLPESSEREKS